MYHLSAFLPPKSTPSLDEIKGLLTSVLTGLGHKVELDGGETESGGGISDLLDEMGRAELAEMGITDLDLLDLDMVVTVDEYEFVLVVNRGEDAADMASELVGPNDASPAELQLLKQCDFSIDLFSEEPDPKHRFKGALEALKGRFEQDWNAVAVIVEG